MELGPKEAQVATANSAQKTANFIVDFFDKSPEYTKL